MSSLMLYPADVDWAPQNAGQIEALLRETGLAGDTLPEMFGPGFSTGENFLSMVTFMGCAPAINLQPDIDEPDREFCAIRILFDDGLPRFVVASRHPPPRCLQCRATIELDTEKPSADSLVTCKQCGKQTRMYALNWRRSAGYARCFIEITGVYPQEALPTDTLLNALQSYSDCEWRYFYR